MVDAEASQLTENLCSGGTKLDADKARSHPNPMLAAVVLKPGMTASVDIKTGRRSVLKYLAKPIYKAFGGALNER